MVWQKGESGNPGGIYRSKEITEAIRRQINAPADDKFSLAKKHKRVDFIAMQLVKDAMKGSLPAIKEIIDRIEGKALQGIEHTGKVEMSGTPEARRKLEQATADGLLTKLDSAS